MKTQVIMTKVLGGSRPLVAFALSMQIKSRLRDPPLLKNKPKKATTLHVTPELLCRTVYF